jgi:heme oxygenase
VRELRTGVALVAHVPESWMLKRLDSETDHEQVIANNDRLAVLEVAADRPRYAEFLARVFGFEAPLEAALLVTRGLDQWLDLRDRGHVRLLRADLNVLGIRDPNALPRCRDIGLFRHPAEALGWAYVVERNTMLHGVIGDHLRGQKVGCSYLQRRSSGQRLRELGIAMARTATDPTCADRIVAAAKAAFRAQHDWYEVAEQPRQQVA